MAEIPPSDLPHPQSRLRVPRTPLVGRDAEIAKVSDLLTRDEAPLITLTGPGGVGKTRLALAVADRLDGAFPDGIVRVPLASIRDPDLVPSALAVALAVRESADRALGDTLATAIGQRRMLLLLDNFEQVLEAAELVGNLLAACPQLAVLVTSRVVLHLTDEWVIRVDPLALANLAQLPALDQVSEIASIRLFVDRARAARSDFRLTASNAPTVAAICARVDGVPLAIELAAAQARLVSPSTLLASLEQRFDVLADGPRDQPARQRTMHNAISWSFDLLGEEQQRLLRSLAVFVGGWTLETADAVCGNALNVRAGLGILVDHSLVRQIEQPDGSSRFAMLETIREFALDQLKAGGEETMFRALHAATFRAFAEDGHPDLGAVEESGERHFHNHRMRPGPPEPDLEAWLSRMLPDLDNLRAALAWLLDSNEFDDAMRMANAMSEIWTVMGLQREGLASYERALTNGTSSPAHLRASAHYRVGFRLVFGGDFSAGRTNFEKSQALWNELHDQYGVLESYMGLAGVAEYQGDVALATRLYEVILDGAGEHSDALVAFTLANLSYMSFWQGELDRAAVLSEQALDVCPQRISLQGLIWLSAAPLAVARGEYERAARLYADLLTASIVVSIKPPWAIAEALAGFAYLAVSIGQPQLAATLLGTVETHMTRLGLSVFSFQLPLERALAQTRAQLSPTAYERAWTEGCALTLDEAIALALAIRATEPGGVKPNYGLTLREVQVLLLIVEGLSDREIAERLFISPHTVMRHVAGILGKLEVSSRTAAATWAVRNGLV